MAERTTEEYLERIGELERLESPVKTSSLAEVLGLSLGSVSEMLQRLSKRELVKYTPYAGVSLTAEGKKSFLMLTRRHRLWEVFLNKYLGIAWEDVFAEACSLEHSTSDLVTDKLGQFLNNPEYCPHGSPIPDSNNRLPEEKGILLSKLELGRIGKMTGVDCESNTQCLRYLTEIGLTPGVKVLAVERSSFDGTLTIEVNGSSKAMSPQLASSIMVEPT